MSKIFKILLLAILCCAQTTFAKQYTYTEKNSLQQLFNQAIAEKAFPGGCIVAGTSQQIFVSECHGNYTYTKKIPDNITSLFDLASLTKVIATTSAIMKLYENGQIKLNDKVVKYLPEFQGPNAAQTQLKATITIKDLLAHASGLPADDSLTTWQAVYTAPLRLRPHQAEMYSDTNFLLLGKIVERVTGISLKKYTEQTIFKPLGMRNTLFNPARFFLHRTVPTIFEPKLHQYLIDIVQDPLAEDLGGSTGNAGLFSDADDLSVFAQMMLNNGRYQGVQIFKPSTVKLFTQRANLVPYSTHALGWDTAYIPSAPYINQFSAGLHIDGNAYGHTGYTGTSLWLSPKYNIFVLLLTNRVTTDEHCNTGDQVEQYWRQRLNSAVWENLGFTKKNHLLEIPAPSPQQIKAKCNHDK